MAVVPVAVAGIALEVLIAQEVLNNLIGQLVSQILSAALAPYFAALQQESFKFAIFSSKGELGGFPLGTADLADAVIKGHRGLAQAMDDATRQGIVNSDFQTLVDSAGEPIPLLTAMEAWRRGIIKDSSSDPNVPTLEKAIRDSRLKNVWFDTVKALQYQLPPIGTIIEAWLRAQLPPDKALALAKEAGVDADTATLMFKAAGRPPSPQELLTLWNRGVIPETGTGGDSISVDQGFLETDLKDKWLATWKKLREYRPPPRTITALQRAGAITDEQALALYQGEGLSKEMAAIYTATAHRERVQATRELTKAELVSLYVDQAIDAPELTRRLLARGWTAADAAAEIDLADLKVAHALEQRAVNRVGTLYTGRKIDKQAAMTTLGSLKLPSAQVDRLIQIWTLERGDNLRHLTPAEIGWLVKSGVMDEASGLDELGNLGYGEHDAWLVLTYETKARLATPEPSGNLPPA